MQSVCILRLSALGDVCHTVPLLRALQHQLPEAHVTWVVDRAGRHLLEGIDGVETIVFDKHGGPRAMAALRRELAGRRFDALLVTQRSLRANLLAALIPARMRVGYDRRRARELHGLVVNARIRDGGADQHAMDCMLSFLEPLGLEVPVRPEWRFALSDADLEFARHHLPDGEEGLIVSPASSRPERNWRPEHYAAVADHAIRRHGFRVLLCGGPSAAERELGDAIVAAMRERPADLIGRDTIKRFLALAARARLVISPDSGAAHLANAMGTPVLGLYAATDSRRSGPYFSRHLCVDEFAAAAERFEGRPAHELRWGKHIHAEGVMDLIRPEAVIDRLDDFVTERRAV